METKKHFSPNVGLIILSLSLIICAVILTENKVTYADRALQNSLEQLKISGTPGGFQIPIGISSSSNDVTYKSEFRAGEGEKLHIVLSNGASETLEGENIVANYYHVSRLLIVHYDLNGVRIFKYYNSPVKWSNRP
jgi:hypothetical protein